MGYRSSHAVRTVREELEALDFAILTLRKANEPKKADTLARVRDFLSRSDAYFRRQEQLSGGKNYRRDNAEREWNEITGFFK